MGIDVLRPRLSWVLESDRRGERQTAYQVVVASSAELLAQDHGDLWNSGKVGSDQSTQVEYAGQPWPSGLRCYWKVRVWDTQGNPSAWSQPATWSMGLLKPEDWKAQWIHFSGKSPVDSADSPWLRKSFVLPAAPKRAVAYVNAVGYFELYVNGRKVGSDVLSPAVSDYGARSLYLTYDITPFLRKGRNCVGLWLGRGWHRAGRLGVQTEGPVVRAQLEIDSGGRAVEIVSDETWKAAPSPYKTLGPWRGEHFGGERYDARLDDPLWSTAEYDDSGWSSAEVVAPGAPQAVAQSCPPNRIGKRIPAATVTDLGNGRYELDFGTNLAGWMHLRLRGLESGKLVTLRYADKRYATVAPEATPAGVIPSTAGDEIFEGANGKIRYQTFHYSDEFVSAGRPREEFCSKFNYHGFRYAIVEGLPARPSTTDAEALLVESDLESSGSFESSNELLNRIHAITLWTLRSLDLGGYLVDCPHRERLGYGDHVVSVDTISMNLWMPAFYGKWMQDWRDAQNPTTGELPHVAPRERAGGGTGWGAVLATLAWRSYLYYGDRQALEANYEATRRYVQYLENMSRDNILRAFGGQWDFLGDWVAPGRGMETNNWPSRPAAELFNNCIRIYLWELLEKTASALGKEDDAQRARTRLEEIRPLIHKAFYDPAKHTYVLDEQPYWVFPLLVDLPPLAEHDAIFRALEGSIRSKGHVDGGMYGTYFLIQYLQQIGRSDLIYTIANQRTYPSWGYMLDQGGTTLWEQWNGFYSQIHSCFTSIGGWFYQGLAGILPDPSVPGFQRIVIKPALVGDLTWVRAHYDSIHGRIASFWRRENGQVTLEVTIPPNTTAAVYIPARSADRVREGDIPAEKAAGVKLLRMEGETAVFEVGSGSYRFTTGAPVIPVRASNGPIAARAQSKPIPR